MGITAENLAAQYKITRAETDAFALSSQTKWKHGMHAGVYFAILHPEGYVCLNVKPMTTVASTPRLPL